MPHRYRSWMWWTDKFASMPRSKRLGLLRWFTLLLCGPTFLALFLSSLRYKFYNGSQYDESVFDRLFGMDTPIVFSPKQAESFQHFDLSQSQSEPLGKATLCAYWCVLGNTYRREMNERYLWDWLGPHCICSTGENASQASSLPSSSKLVVFVGDNLNLVDAMRHAILSPQAHHGEKDIREYREIGHLSCSEVLTPSSRGLREADALRDRSGQGGAVGETLVVYIFSECPRSKSSESRERVGEESVSRQMFSLYSDVDRALTVIRGLKARAVEMDSRSDSKRLVSSEVVWYVDSSSAHSRPGVRATRQEAIDLEADVLQQFLLQRHVLFGRGVLILDVERLLSSRSDQWRWLSRSAETMAGRPRGMAQGPLQSLIEEKRRQSRGMSPRPERAAAPTLAAKSSLLRMCGALLNSRGYDDRCLPRPHLLFPVLVTGLGGSGTHSVSDSLHALGIDMPHESIGAHGSVCWQYAVNDVLIGTTYPHHARLRGQHAAPGATDAATSAAVVEGSVLSPRFQRVVHVTRPAMAQISSLTTHLPASYAFIYRAVQVMLELRELLLSDGEDEGEGEGAVFFSSVVESVQNARHKQLVSGSGSAPESGRGGRGPSPNPNLRSCPRGGRCHLHFAAVAWLLWNAHVASYLGPDATRDTFRLEKEEAYGGNGGSQSGAYLRLILRTCSLVEAASASASLAPGWGRQRDGDEYRHIRKACGEVTGLGLAAFAPARRTPRSPHHSEHTEYRLDDLRKEDAPLADSVATLDHTATEKGK